MIHAIFHNLLYNKALIQQLFTTKTVGLVYCSWVRVYRELLKVVPLVMVSVWFLLWVVMRQGKLRAAYWLTGSIALIGIPLASFYSWYYALCIGLVQFYYAFLCVNAVRATIGVKSFKYFMHQFLLYGRLYVPLIGFVLSVCVYAVNQMKDTVIVDYLFGIDHHFYSGVAIRIYLVIHFLLMVSWYLWYILDMNPEASYKRVVTGIVWYTIDLIVYQAIIALISCILVVLWGLLLYGIFTTFTLLGVGYVAPTRAIALVWGTYYVILYPLLAAWWYVSYVQTRYGRADRYIVEW